LRMSDCTEITAKEFFKFYFPANYSGHIEATLDYVDIDFNACRASKNNNLERFVQRLRDEGRLSRQIYDKFRNTVVGDNQCNNAIRDLIFDKGYGLTPKTVKNFESFQNGYCVNLHGQDQNSGVVKIGTGDYGQTTESKQKCLNLCARYSSENRVSACEAIHGQWNRGCYLHTEEVYRGNGVSKHFCAVMNLYKLATKQEFLPTQAGFCLDSNGNDQNSGVIKLWGGDFGPSESKQMECVEKCIAASGVRKTTGCEAIWHQGNRGCYLHTQDVSKANGADRHSCWLL